MDITIRKKVIDGIPLLELADAGGAQRPLVLMYHGYVNRKDFMLNQAYFLASHGFTVAVPDAWGHGERSTGGICNFFEAVLKTADDIDVLLDHYRHEPLADASRAGLTGYSMGGCIAYEYIARPGRRIKAAVPFIGTPDWVSLMSAPGTAQEFMKSGLVKTAEEMAPYIGLAAQIQPLNRMAEIAGLPLLMLNGADDPLMPVAAMEKFYNQLKPLYINGEDLKLAVCPGVGHSDTVEMNMEMAMWFIRHL